MKEVAKEIVKSWLTPGTLIIVLLGANSILDCPTVLSFNVGERVTQIPIPALGTTTGWLLLVLPVILLIRPLISRLRKVRETSLPTEPQTDDEQAEKQRPKSKKLRRLLDLLLYLPLPHK